MKAKIHPKYYNNCQVTCACGNTFKTGSTKPELKVEVCGSCHPFFTGEMKYVDTLGRVEKFKQKQDASSGKTYLKKKQRQAIKRAKAAKKASQAPKTLKDMLKTSKPLSQTPKKSAVKDKKDKTS